MEASKVVIPQWHEMHTSHILVEENGESLVCLGDAGNPRILYEPRYFMRGIPGATTECRMRKSVYEKLTEAVQLLPAGYCFKIFDAWRSYTVQKFLFEEQVGKLISSRNIPPEIAKEEAKRFVSKPGKDAKNPFVHSTGGAVDLTIVDKTHANLNMGTQFDAFSQLAQTDAFETSGDCTVRDNRRLLYAVMTAVGFTNYPSEWWHFDYGDAFWAAESKEQISFFGGIY